MSSLRASLSISVAIVKSALTPHLKLYVMREYTLVKDPLNVIYVSNDLKKRAL